jgi:hypothetical protein
MASVRINFVQPDSEGLTRLLIYESGSKDGIYTLIEAVENIGEFPDYISYYTTDQAANAFDWFVIEWEDDKGARSPRSNPIQGNTTTTPGEVAGRVLMRDMSIDEKIAVQESEIVICDYFMVDDPYMVDPVTVTYKEWGGLTYLALARVYITDLLVGASVQGYTAGIVAQQQGSAAKSLGNIKDLIALANELLGRNYSVVMQIEEFDPVTGFGLPVEIDQTRLLVELT